MASKDGSTFFFTSESVNEGHPDKLADQVRGARRSIVETHSIRSFARTQLAGWPSGRRAAASSTLSRFFFLSFSGVG